MAVVYELVVNFGTDESAVAKAEGVCSACPPVRIRDLDLPLAGPHITRFQNSYIEFSVGISGIHFGGPRHPGLDPSSLSGPDLGSARDGFYGLLSKLDGYQIAMVGWDPEDAVDERELRLRLDEFGTVGLGGLVLRPALAMDLGLGGSVEPFAGGYVRLPPELEPKVWWR